MRRRIYLSIVAALLVGVIQNYVGAFVFAYAAAYSPLPHLLLSHHFHGAAFLIPVLLADLFVGVVISLPAAFLLLRLSPPKLSLYLALAVLPSVLWFNYWLFVAPDFVPSLGQAALGWPFELLALPAAVGLLRSLLPPRAPNKSFKPNPLRGSA